MPCPDRSPARRPVRLGLAIGLLVVLTIGTLGGTSAAVPGTRPAALATQPVPADSVLLSVALQPDGSARWRVEYRTRLDDDNATKAFEALQADVRANRSAYVDRFSTRMSATVADAASLTGRSMALRNVSVTASEEQLPQTYGVLAYTFEWTGFARVDGHRLHAGDAMAGLFLDSQTTLLLSWPAGYRVATVSPTPTTQRQQSVVWRGPMNFGPGEPSLVLSSGGGADTSLLGVAIVALVLVGAGGLVWWRRRDGGWPGFGPGRDGRHRTASTATSDDEIPDETGQTADVPASGPPAEPPPELLSNEERVLALLRERGGRLKQQDVVEALGWTDAKTSQVVGKLRDAGEVEGFRLGRENVLRLPEDGPLGAPSDREGSSDREDDTETDAADPGDA